MRNPPQTDLLFQYPNKGRCLDTRHIHEALAACGMNWQLVPSGDRHAVEGACKVPGDQLTWYYITSDRLSFPYHRQVAFMGYARWVDRRGTVHARLVAGREPMGGHPDLEHACPPWRPEFEAWGSTHFSALVYAELQVRRPRPKDNRTLAGMLDYLWCDPLDVCTWSQLHDWQTDHGSEQAIRDALAGLTRAVVLAAL